MRKSSRTLIAISAITLALGPLAAQAQMHRGGHGGGHGGHGYAYRGPGPFWGGLGIGIGLGAYYYGAPWYPGYLVVPPPEVAYYGAPPLPDRPATGSAPDPVIYPRNGQSPAQTESDRQECNRWATTQASAMTDASVFQRATLACMDGRGYTVR